MNSDFIFMIGPLLLSALNSCKQNITILYTILWICAIWKSPFRIKFFPVCDVSESPFCINFFEVDSIEYLTVALKFLAVHRLNITIQQYFDWVCHTLYMISHKLPFGCAVHIYRGQFWTNSHRLAESDDSSGILRGLRFDWIDCFVCLSVIRAPRQIKTASEVLFLWIWSFLSACEQSSPSDGDCIEMVIKGRSDDDKMTQRVGAKSKSWWWPEALGKEFRINHFCWWKDDKEAGCKYVWVTARSLWIDDSWGKFESSTWIPGEDHVFPCMCSLHPSPECMWQSFTTSQMSFQGCILSPCICAFWIFQFVAVAFTGLYFCPRFWYT